MIPVRSVNVRSCREVYGTEQRRGITTAAPYARGEMVAVRYQSQWYRARVLEFKPSTNFAWVRLVIRAWTRHGHFFVIRFYSWTRETRVNWARTPCDRCTSSFSMCPYRRICAVWTASTPIIRGHRRIKIFSRRRYATRSSMPRKFEVRRSSCGLCLALVRFRTERHSIGRVCRPGDRLVRCLLANAPQSKQTRRTHSSPRAHRKSSVRTATHFIACSVRAHGHESSTDAAHASIAGRYCPLRQWFRPESRLVDDAETRWSETIQWGHHSTVRIGQ